MTEEDDYWVKSALQNDSMVAELLILLRESVPLTQVSKRPFLVEWGVRQPRSREIPRFDVKGKSKIGELTRASPTTPLSWSAGTSRSNSAGEGYEESSLRLCSARSKVFSTSEINAKRSKKKKTFPQLKEQESFLMKEGVHLKNALASERMQYQAEKVRNESLKRLKLDMQLQSTLTGISKKPTSNQSYQADAVIINQAFTVLTSSGKQHNKQDTLFCPWLPGSYSTAPQKNESVARLLPILPDLNMLPDLNLPFEDM